jgi:putative hydrolase of the HAD superfamily
MPIRGVVFDLDDTLVDHAGAAHAGFQAWLPTLGPTPLHPDESETLWVALEERHYQRYLDGLIPYAEKRRARLREFWHALGRQEPLSDPDVDEAFADYLAAYTRAWRAHADALPTLQRVRRAGLAVAVLTNGDQRQQEAKLRATGLIGACGPVYASSGIGAAKPSATAYAAVSDALGLPADQLLMVGDNPVADVRGALDAGWQAVHLDRQLDRQLDRAGSTGADTIASLSDLVW